MHEPRHPHIRLATEYGHIIGQASARQLMPLPAATYGQEPVYIPFEAARKHEEPVHTVILVAWTNAVANKVLLVPYAEMAAAEIDGTAFTFRSNEYMITIEGDNLQDWAFLDAFVKHRVKSIRQWNPSLHNRPNAGRLCINRISWTKRERKQQGCMIS
jgi:hypothetical protein